MEAIDTLNNQREVLLNNLNELKNKKYHLSKDTFKKSFYKKALNAIDKINIDIEKLEYNQPGVISVLKLYLSASKKHTTAIRGHNTYTKGYEIDNKYSVSYIAFHSVDINTIEKLKTEFKELKINVSIDKNGLQILK